MPKQSVCQLIGVFILTFCTRQSESTSPEFLSVCIRDESTGSNLKVSVKNPDGFAVLLVENEFGKLLSEWEVGFPVVKIDVGDADGDGNVNLLLLTPKPTRKDPEHNLLRPFIFSLGNGHIYPRWLGSTFGFPLIDFRVSAPGQIVVWMQMDSSNFMVATYSMDAFSPRFEGIIYEGNSYVAAKSHFIKP